MASSIDPTHPADGVAVPKATSRANWQAAHDEIEALQTAVAEGSDSHDFVDDSSDYTSTAFNPGSGGSPAYASNQLRQFSAAGAQLIEFDDDPGDDHHGSFQTDDASTLTITASGSMTVNGGTGPISVAAGYNVVGWYRESATSIRLKGQTDEDVAFPGGVEFQGQISEAYNTIAASGAATIDLSLGSVFATTLSGNITSMSITNEPSSGTAASFVLKVVNDGSSTITWNTSIDWPGGTAPTLSSGNGDVDWFSFITHDGGTTWYGFTAGQNFS